ncbi:hypothetical protein [Arthrobacter sp.]|uniref:hypothetical protein n=1 Tax=Arthrobacter sp. TaxID=1667 RepID=UPI00339496C8
MEFAIIIAILLAACIAWVVLGARADRRPAKGARAPVTTEAASTAASGGDAGAGGGDCG